MYDYQKEEKNARIKRRKVKTAKAMIAAAAALICVIVFVIALTSYVSKTTQLNTLKKDNALLQQQYNNTITQYNNLKTQSDNLDRDITKAEAAIDAFDE